MGNTAAGRLTATYFGTAATVLGAVGGSESRSITISAANLPASAPTFDHGILSKDTVGAATAVLFTGTGSSLNVVSNVGGITASTPQNLGSGTTNTFPAVSPVILVTIYLKL